MGCQLSSEPAARRAAQDAVRLARRVGYVPLGSGIPQAIMTFPWSHFNVPLIWSAAGSDRSNALLEWVCSIAEHMAADETCAEDSFASEIRSGFDALRTCLRAWGILVPLDLANWLEASGFPAIAAGQYFGQAEQQFVMQRAICMQGAVANLEAAYVTTVAHPSKCLDDGNLMRAGIEMPAALDMLMQPSLESRSCRIGTDPIWSLIALCLTHHGHRRHPVAILTLLSTGPGL